MLLTIISLLLSACSLGISQDFPPPTAAVVIPTPILQSNLAPSPTAPSLAEPTAVATVTPVLDNNQDNPQTTAPDSSAQFHNLYFASTNNGLPQGTYIGGTEEVFAIWDYTDLSAEDVIRRVWTKNDEEWLVREEAWDVVRYGSSGMMRDISVYDFEGSGLEPGFYHLTLYLNGIYQVQASFQIRTETTLATSTETQVAHVQEGYILMLDAWDGSQRELARATKIVELLWLPDARHLLYVDQQPQADPNGPPWPQHAVWLVDTETAESHQISTYDENLHRISLLPGARYLRTMPGSDFGDACFMDRGLVFVELDEDYQRVALHNFHDFEGVPIDQDYWFFPEDAGKWFSDHEYDVNLTAYCMSAEMGTSEEDLALIGRYRMDLEAGTAIKIGD